MGYLQLINKLIEYDDADEAIVAELQRLFQALTLGDRDHFREVLDGTREPDDEELSYRFSLENLRGNFIVFVVINYPYKSSLEWFREYITRRAARTMLEELQEYDLHYRGSGDATSERILGVIMETRKIARLAKNVLEAGILEPAIAPFIVADAYHHISPEDFVELMTDQITAHIQTERDKARLEKAIVFWDNVVSKITRRTLRRIYLDANLNTLEKANAARMLILLGDAQLTWSI